MGKVNPQSLVFVTGNSRLLEGDNLWTFEFEKGTPIDAALLMRAEKETEEATLRGQTIVAYSHWPADLAQQVGVVPLRWGAPRILVNDSIRGYRWAKSIEAGNEPERCWRLWRYCWDPHSDALAKPVPKRAPKPA